jgi:hypothetical protein
MHIRIRNPRQIESDTRIYLKCLSVSDGIGGGGTAAIIIALMLVGAVAVILTVQLRYDAL